MKERPILFSAPMVRAILDGTKTVTRRLVSLRQFGVTDTNGYDWTFRCKRGLWQDYTNAEFLASKHAKAHVGDRLWVKETHAVYGQLLAFNADGWAGAYCQDGAGGILHLQHGFVSTTGAESRVRGDHDKLGARFGLARYGGKWKPSIFMRRELSRITLEVIDVRVERLHAITEDDARAEGVERDTEPCDHTRQSCEDIGCMGPTYRSTFAELWDAINGERGAWSTNPWVWRVEFKRVDEKARAANG